MRSTPEHEAFMRLALDEARLADSEGEVPVGAVLVRGGNVVARAHNRTAGQKDPTAHAELLTLRAGAEALSGRFDDCTLYVTMEPCAMCAGAAANCKLPKLVFGAFDRKAGCCGSVLDVADHALLWTVETWGGVLESECAALLSDFFQKLR